MHSDPLPSFPPKAVEGNCIEPYFPLHRLRGRAGVGVLQVTWEMI